MQITHKYLVAKTKPSARMGGKYSKKRQKLKERKNDAPTRGERSSVRVLEMEHDNMITGRSKTTGPNVENRPMK